MYSETSGIHTGLDYGKRANLGIGWETEDLLALCDGVIIPSRNSPPFGGSVADGTGGVALRCFVDNSNDSPAILSNIVLSYNHLQFVDGNPVVLVETGQVVRQGDPIARSGPDESQYDHLHLEVFLARGHERNNPDGDRPIILNPMLMFTSGIVVEHIEINIGVPHIFFNYHPIRFGTGGTQIEPPEKTGITLEDGLDQWSTGANHPDKGADPMENFWQVQNINQPGVEWPPSIYVLDENDFPLAPTVLVPTLMVEYMNDPYIAPICEFAIINGKEMITNCMSSITATR